MSSSRFFERSAARGEALGGLGGRRVIWLRALSFVVAVQLTVIGVIPWLLAGVGPRVPMSFWQPDRHRASDHGRSRPVVVQLGVRGARPRWWPRVAPWRGGRSSPPAT